MQSFSGNYWSMYSTQKRNKIKKKDDMGSNTEVVRISKIITRW